MTNKQEMNNKFIQELTETLQHIKDCNYKGRRNIKEMIDYVVNKYDQYDLVSSWGCRPWGYAYHGFTGFSVEFKSNGTLKDWSVW